MTEERQKQLEERAYALWEAEGHPADRADAHWHQAEHEIGAEVEENVADESSVLLPAIGEEGADSPAPLEAALPASTAIPSGRRKKK